jgi:hypothetical protein
MMMHFHGGGVGHKSTRQATDWFLSDCDKLDKGGHQENPPGLKTSNYRKLLTDFSKND